MKSKNNLLAERQRVLDLSRRAEPNEVPIEMIRKKGTSGGAFTLACDSSGLDDKNIYEPLGIDAGTFSKIKIGIATLQAGLIANFCLVVNNRIYPEWIAYQLGCTLTELRTEAERRADEAERQLAEERAKVRILTDALHGRISGQ